MKQRNKSRINEDRNFHDIILFLIQKAGLIVKTVLLFTLISIIKVSFFSPPSFKSSAKIFSSSNLSSSQSQMMGLASQFGINLNNNSKSDQSWISPDIIKSRSIARKVVNEKFDTEKFGLQKTGIEIYTYGNKEPLDIKNSKYEQDAIEFFLKNISISENINSGIITITIESFEPELAKELLSTLLLTLSDYQESIQRGQSKKTKLFIESRIKATKEELEILENNLKDFTDRNRRIENSPALKLEQQRLSREVLVISNVFTTLKQQYETVRIEELKDKDYLVVLDPPEIPMFRSSPNKKRTVIMAIAFGLIFSIFLGLIIRYYENISDDEKSKLNLIKHSLMSLGIFRFINDKFSFYPK